MRALLSLLLLPVPALAQAICNPVEAVRQQLSQKYDEAPVGRGLDSRGNVVEVWRSRHGETWTITYTRPDGLMCAITAGASWEDVDYPEEGHAS